MMKVCGKCQAELALTSENFGRRPNSLDGFVGVCRPCVRQRRNASNEANRKQRNRQQQVWRANLPGEAAERARKKTRDWYWANADHAKRVAKERHARIRAEMLKAYGGKCACCGEKEPMFLTIDHIRNDGTAHRRSLGGPSGQAVMMDLYKRGWPTDGYRLLCFNCNCGRQRNGGVCPHEVERMFCSEASSEAA